MAKIHIRDVLLGCGWGTSVAAHTPRLANRCATRAARFRKEKLVGDGRECERRSDAEDEKRRCSICIYGQGKLNCKDDARTSQIETKL